MHHIGNVVVGEVIESIKSQSCTLLIFETPYCLANSLMLLFAHNFFFCCQSTGAIFQDNAIKRDIAAILSQHFGDDIDCDSINESRSEERRVGKECRSRWS